MFDGQDSNLTRLKTGCQTQNILSLNFESIKTQKDKKLDEIYDYYD